ncbi:MAG: N-acetyltransferase [Candidatus Omnitrophica bacterium]|nr:N-acetyltransferase [Candidatus Omnitrophota bacterium]
MIRKPKLKDVQSIYNLISNFAKQNFMLARSLNEIYENLRDFWVYELEKKIIGCCALHISWENFAEIKSLAVEKRFQNKKIGTALVEACIQEAKHLGIRNIFVLTYIPTYFSKFGFKKIKHEKLPHKIWFECIRCPKFPYCKEVAMIKKI